MFYSVCDSKTIGGRIAQAAADPPVQRIRMPPKRISGDLNRPVALQALDLVGRGEEQEPEQERE